jgi:hypothetical protein
MYSRSSIWGKNSSFSVNTQNMQSTGKINFQCLLALNEKSYFLYSCKYESSKRALVIKDEKELS